jgi:predicted metal-dependent hydrolase
MRPLFRSLKNALRTNGSLPDEVYLPALEQCWAVQYRKTAAKTVQARCDGNGTLVVSGEIRDGKKVTEALRRWMSRQAKNSLVPWLEELSYENAMPYARVAVRGQKTRWGSCSTRGNINLNWKLLFLPPDVVRYVLLHELCHTIHMNHSNRFWSRLAALEPEFRLYRSAVRKGMKHVPVWAK